VKITLSKEEIQKLKVLDRILDSYIPFKGSNTILYVDKDAEQLNLYTKNISTIIESSIFIKDINSLEDEEKNFFSLSLSKFVKALEKLTDGDILEAADIEIQYEESSNKVLCTSMNTGSKISISSFEDLDSGDLNEIKNFYDDKLNSSEFSLKDKVCSVSIGKDFSTFSKQALKSMSSYGKSTALKIDNNKLIYGDRLACYQFSSQQVSTSGTDPVYIHMDVINLINSLIKEDDSSINVVVSSSKKLMLINDEKLNIKSIISIPAVSFEFPNNEEIKKFTPDDSDYLKFNVKKNELIKA